MVEDDPINYELIRTMLEPSNAKIIHAESGEDALRLFSKVTSINIILMDIRLPGINGYQAMRSIKDINPAVPVIAQTAFAMSEDNQSCLEQGFDDYIAKPINRKLLFKIIQKQFTN
ncbi:MAG TPA: response regulator [Bacteroidales bacterium]|nr:response regulator [Bacteroidales bacterium]